MIVICINCNKKFELNSDLIPENGRTIQCGSCNHIWFFKKNTENTVLSDVNLDKNNEDNRKNILSDKELKKEPEIIENNPSKNKTIKKVVKRNFTLGKFLSYIVVTIISFFALIIILDTFKNNLTNIFPNLELVLFNLFETMKDILLFFKDLT
tara:strand:- start:61 stop:519 length:459 start_codon:yes stop_codon:yes gene_type:complete